MHTKIVYTGIHIKKGHLCAHCQNYPGIPAHTDSGMRILRIPKHVYVDMLVCSLSGVGVEGAKKRRYRIPRNP